MELNVPFVVLSQLNRKSVDRAGPPGLADLRDSGSVEQDADVVLMLSNEQANTLSLSIQKNRQGPEALLRGRIDRSTMKLLELVKA
jgi:replicative DNA helicase